MILRLSLRSALLAAAALGATASLADEPGPGGSKVSRPVTGEQVYRAVCQSCHMADARGGTGAATIPALAGNKALAAPEYPITMIATGRGAMPALTDMLDPGQIAAVVTYVRTHFGNHYTKPVTAQDVRKVIGTVPAPPQE
jgi:mono/diheme cytochrome c family protein